MFQTFYTNTIESKFIKALLHNTPLSNLQSVQDEDYIVKDICYVYKNQIIKCTYSGYLGNKIISSTGSNNEQVYKLAEKGKFEKICDYKLGESIPKFTSQYYSKTSYYDVDTHIKLGKLLRDVNNIYGINLLPFYNCYCPKYLNNSTRDIIIPIQFDQQYTIAINCPIAYSITPIFYDGFSLLTPFETKIIGGSSFTQPFLYESPNQTVGSDSLLQLIDTRRNQLYLKITIPENYQKSIVILQGDFTNNSYKVFNNSKGVLQQMSDKTLNKLLISKPTLLNFTDGNTYAFCNTLIEYLLSNVITNLDIFNKNILRTQKYLNNDNDLLIDNDEIDQIKINENGIWSTELRVLLYQLYMKNYLNFKGPKYRQNDITGFVDKHMENYIRQTSSTASPQEIDDQLFNPQYDWIR